MSIKNEIDSIQEQLLSLRTDMDALFVRYANLHARLRDVLAAAKMPIKDYVVEYRFKKPRAHK